MLPPVLAPCSAGLSLLLDCPSDLHLLEKKSYPFCIILETGLQHSHRGNYFTEIDAVHTMKQPSTTKLTKNSQNWSCYTQTGASGNSQCCTHCTHCCFIDYQYRSLLTLYGLPPLYMSSLCEVKSEVLRICIIIPLHTCTGRDSVVI